MKIYFLVSLILFSTYSKAFNWSRCKSSVQIAPTKNEPDLSGKVIQKMLSATTKPFVEATTNWTVGSMVSVTSYISSTGACKAIGLAEGKRMEYIAQTHNELQREISKGSGDYASTLGRLYGCNELGRHAFSGIIRQKQSEIFSPKNNNAEYITYLISTTVEQSDFLSANCDPALVI
jgi:hypothetical protein